MATRKQRRRRAKEHRHEYVWEDEDGNVLETDDARAAIGNGSKPRTPDKQPAKGGRGSRTPQPASWRRTFKRGGIFAPIMLATVMLLNSTKTFAEQVTSTLIVLAVFVPFSYVLDGMMYRSYRKRLAKLGSDGKA
jgi:hypothetical protein